MTITLRNRILLLLFGWGQFPAEAEATTFLKRLALTLRGRGKFPSYVRAAPGLWMHWYRRPHVEPIAKPSPLGKLPIKRKAS